MGSLTNLKELDVSFNEMELIPKSLCLSTNLVKLNVGSNFANLHKFPRSIGNLGMFEELDIINDQINVLSDSFHMLTYPQILKYEETPLEIVEGILLRVELRSLYSLCLVVLQKGMQKKKRLSQRGGGQYSAHV